MNARANQTVAVTVKMRPAARISTTVVDAATGAPVAGVCAGAFKPKHVAQPDGFGYCSDAAGRLTIGRLTAGTYRLFVDPTEAPRYGRQWLGATGGTGDERQAASVTATAGEVATAPTVRLDPAGSIAGTVTDGTTGVPIEFSSVDLLTSHPGAGLSETSTDEDGHYRIDRLGPYAWPLRFGATGYAGQWSGNAADRYAATPVQVTAGGVATGDIGLVRGVEVRGTVALEDGTPVDGYVATKNAETGDYAGTDYAEDGTYLIRVIAGQRVSYAYDVYAGDRYFSSDRAAVATRRTRRTGAVCRPRAGDRAGAEPDGGDELEHVTQIERERERPGGAPRTARPHRFHLAVGGAVELEDPHRPLARIDDPVERNPGGGVFVPLEDEVAAAVAVGKHLDDQHHIGRIPRGAALGLRRCVDDEDVGHEVGGDPPADADVLADEQVVGRLPVEKPAELVGRDAVRHVGVERRRGVTPGGSRRRSRSGCRRREATPDRRSSRAGRKRARGGWSRSCLLSYRSSLTVRKVIHNAPGSPQVLHNADRRTS